ncbi:MAG: isocitrate lyase/PEP mutase family protein, partial [Gemmatimonadaceae bacterium]|nr:isocitrate lyase/PEP mutase family protein [Acetobacteraceae bacterium]
MSARIAEDLGFEAGILAGSTASLAVLGAPDLIVLTLPELAEQARRIGRAAGIPLLVDADHGYGNALNVMRTVQELEAAGVAALTIEDTDLPRRFAASGPALLTLAEGLGKIEAALAARTDPALVIVARTSALAITGFADTLERVRAYSAAGADAIFLAGADDASQVVAIGDAAGLPLIVAGDGGAVARIHLQGHQPIMAAIQAIHATMQALRDGQAPSGLAPAPLLRAVTRGAAYDGWTRDFLGT